jgi:rhamnogalacturonan lyase-like protein
MDDISLNLRTLWEADLGQPIGQLRATPVRLGQGSAFLVAYAADFDVDPYIEMFFFPTDTLKLALLSQEGKVLWRRDLGRAVVPGMHFCPFCAFDLDGDGVDEIYFVNNTDENHPLGVSHYVLERLDAASGESTGQWPWPQPLRETLSSTFRFFLFGGRVRGEPVLVSAQGTYGVMRLQAWNAPEEQRWTYEIPAQAPGARGAHHAVVIDINRDGADEILWGERCIALDTGQQLWCADEDTYRGHSDVIQPVLDPRSGRWFVYTCREGDGQVAPRVALYDDQGQRVWGQIETGHMDMGWAAQLGDEGLTAMAIRIGHKMCGPDGRHHSGAETFAFDAWTGRATKLTFDPYGTIPVDLNGDGRHEIVRGSEVGDSAGGAYDRYGGPAGHFDGHVAMARKLLDHPGEQIFTYRPDGRVTIVGDANAQDSPAALRRYEDPYYSANPRGGSLIAGL